MILPRPNITAPKTRKISITLRLVTSVVARISRVSWMTIATGSMTSAKICRNLPKDRSICLSYPPLQAATTFGRIHFRPATACKKSSTAYDSPMSRFLKLVGRALLLRCPVCGKGKLFSGIFRVPEKCPACGAPYAREAGFFLGSIYINYGLTSLIAAVVYPILMFNKLVPEPYLTIGSLAFVVIFPLLFFRHARSLWIGFDQWYDPREGEV